MHPPLPDVACSDPPRWSETERLAALDRYAVLDTGREPVFDEVAELAADLLDAPVAVVNFIAADRQWFKAEVGINADTLPLDVSICRHAILQSDVLVVPDLREDPRFENNPLVTAADGLRFYAGALLETPEGLPLGTVCVLDTAPRPDGLSPRQLRALRALAAQTMAHLELRRSAAALRESEARFREMADDAPVMMWVTDPSGVCTYLNRRWYEFTGQTPEEAEGYGWLDATHPDDKARAEEAFLSANDRREPFRVEYRLRQADGRYCWAIDAASPRFGSGGEYLGYIGSVIDIDERREAEDRLRLSEQRFRAAVDAVQGVLWTNDAAGRMMGEQPGWERLTGQSRAEYEGYGWTSAVHPDDAGPTVDAWNQAVAERRTFVFEHRVRRADGGWGRYAIRAVPTIADTGEITEWVGVHTDITAQRDAEAALRDERDRAHGYLNVAEVMLLVLDERGCVQTINRRGAEILGLDGPEALIGRDWFDLAIPPARRAETRSVFGRLMSGQIEAAGSYENPVIRADGTERLIAWRNSVLRDADGRVTGTLSSGDDITDQRLARDRERLLAQEIDHRAKNLLAVVQSVVQLTRADDIRTFKTAVTGRIQSLARTHGLLAASRWEGADLKQLVCDELAPYDRADAGRVSIVGPALQLTPAAAQALALVVHELATNSAKYGALSVEAGALRIEWTRPKPGSGSMLALDWIEEDGPPVTRPERRGFGSVVLQTSVERQLGGTVDLNWRPQGLRCRIQVPAAETIASGHLPTAERAGPSGTASATGGLAAGARVLVVEDEALIAAQIEDVLADAGYVVLGPASRLADAFDQFYRTPPDAALLDINVAGERSFPLAEFLTAKGVPFAFCSGYGEASAVPEQFRHVPVIAKPADSAALVAVLGRLRRR
jgi:PAS domain S-box-containing protein